MIATRSCAELEHVRQELLHECELILTSATAVDHLMIPSAVIVLHCRQLRTPRSTHTGYLVQTVLGHTYKSLTCGYALPGMVQVRKRPGH